MRVDFFFHPETFRIFHRKFKLFGSGELAIHRTKQQSLMQKLAETLRTVTVTILVHAHLIMVEESTL